MHESYECLICLEKFKYNEIISIINILYYNNGTIRDSNYNNI